MKTITTTGARCFPRGGFLPLPCPAWSERVGMTVVMPRAGGCRRGIGASDVRPTYRTRFHALINPEGIDLPVIHRMHASASEP